MRSTRQSRSAAAASNESRAVPTDAPAELVKKSRSCVGRVVKFCATNAAPPARRNPLLAGNEKNNLATRTWNAVSTPPPTSLTRQQSIRRPRTATPPEHRAAAFLGHFTGRSHDYYVRQYHDMKGAIDLAALAPDEFRAYARTCGTLLARAHAQSAPATAIAAYLDGTDAEAFDRAIGAWSAATAVRAAEDREAVLAAAIA